MLNFIVGMIAGFVVGVACCGLWAWNAMGEDE